MTNMNEFNLTIADLEQENKNNSIGINKFIGEKLHEIILKNINIAQTKIVEYDWQIIEDSGIILKLIDNQYLCLNKIYVKSFYREWRGQLLSNELNTAKYDEVTLNVLLINPNVATAWSKRKFLIEKGIVELPRELELNALILVKHVKCECAYIHRRWLVKRIKNMKDFLSGELQFFFENLCFKKKGNYYCWSYLNWILFFVQQNELMIEEKIKNTLECFFKKLASLIYLNPSDNCIFHSRLNLITKLNNANKLCYLYESNEDFSFFITNELEIFDDLLFRYSNMSTIWNYRKYFFLFLRSFKNLKCNIKFDYLNKLIIQMNNSNLENKDALFRSIKLNENDWFNALIQREIYICQNVTSNEKLKGNFLNFLNKFVKV